MAAIANLQYAWTIFTKPLSSGLHASLAAVQVAFATFVVAETWLVPFEGYLVDRIGPKIMLLVGGVLVALGWIGSGYATTVHQLVFWYTIGGIGAGIVYGGTIGNALKWFPDHRGLCVGITAGAYGVGTAATVAPIAHMLKTSGYAHTFVVWGLIQGATVIVASLFINKPKAGWTPPNWAEKQIKIRARIRCTGKDVRPLEMVQSGSFWIIYLMMTIVAFGGLVITAQLAPIASFYKVDKTVIAFGMSALVLAIEVNRILNGLTRPFWGWISDLIGRENSMFIAFMLEAAATFALLTFIDRPIYFILLSGVAFFAWGEIFSLFPSITADLFGSKWATTNYGIVYTAKGTASIFAGPVVAALAAAKTGWVQIFYMMIACDIIAAIMALVWLKPYARRTLAEQERLRLQMETAESAA